MAEYEKDMTNNQSKEKPKANDWLIDNITEASKNARQIYFLYIGFLAYCALTIVSTSDRQIILNEEASLPIIKLDVSLSGFFILSPIISLLVFTYLQLYLQRLKGLITDLRANYALVENRRLYPWMLNIAEDPEPGIVGKLQIMFVNFSLWWSLPLVLVLNSLWFIKKHAPILSYVIGVMPILAVFVVFYFWRRYEFVHDKYEGNKSSFLRYIRKNSSKVALSSFVILHSMFLLCYVVPLSNKGEGVNVDLSNQKLIEKPNPNDDYDGLHWVDLNKVHLEGANLTTSVLERADLRFAELQNADLKDAILEKASLQSARLDGAKLGRANLKGAKLVGTRLDGADLQFAELMKANLLSANFKDAKLQYTNFEGARLEDTNFEGANLEGANLVGTTGLTIEQLSNVETLYGAELDSELEKQLIKKFPHLFENPTEQGSQVIIEKQKNVEEMRLQHEIKEEGYITDISLSRSNIVFEAGEMASKRIIVTGGKIPYATRLLGRPAPGLEVLSPVHGDSVIVIKANENTVAGTYIVQVSDANVTQAKTLKIQILKKRGKGEYLTEKKAYLLYLNQEGNPQGYITNQFEEKNINNDLVVIDHATNLMWEKSGSKTFKDYENTKIYIEKRNREKYAGKSDWRLPTLVEALTLLEQEKKSNGLYIDPVFDIHQKWIWTSDRSDALRAWVVHFNDLKKGDICRIDAEAYHVRAVR